MKPNRLFVGLLALCVALLAPAGAPAQQGHARLASAAHETELAAVAANRVSVVQGIVNRWTPYLGPANPALNDDGGVAELNAALKNSVNV